MILVDPRRGSGELLKYFSGFDVQVVLADGHDDHPPQLDFGDFAFMGNGPQGLDSIGMERKVLSDLMSSLRDNRLTGFQLGGLLDTYNWVYLIVEGIWKCGDSGLVEVLGRKGFETYFPGGKKAVHFREIDHALADLQHHVGVTVAYTSDPKQTAAYIVSRYKFWNDKSWNQRSDDLRKSIYAPSDIGPDRTNGKHKPRFVITKPQLPARTAAQVDGLYKSAFDVQAKFRSLYGWVNASVEEWAELELTQQLKGGGSRKVRMGRERAERIWRQIREEW